MIEIGHFHHLYVFCKHLGISSITEEAFKPFIKSEWDYYVEWNQDVVRYRDIINLIINEICYLNFTQNDLKKFFVSVDKLINLNSPSFELEHTAEDGFEKIKLSIEPLASDKELIEELVNCGHSLELAKTTILVHKNLDEVREFVSVTKADEKLPVYIAEIYDTALRGVTEALRSAIYVIDEDEDYNMEIKPFTHNAEEINSLFVKLKKVIFDNFNSNMSLELIERLNRLQVNPVNTLYNVFVELRGNKAEDMNPLMFESNFD